MEDIMSRLKNWFIQQEWKVIINPDKSVKLSSASTKRYSTMDAEYFTFLKSFQRVISNDERTWFLCANEYNEISDLAFKWNEFELLSLEAAQGDDEWKGEIEAWWKHKLPIIMSVKNGYSFYAIDLDSETSAIIKGEEPEFEEAEIVTKDFYEFLNMLMSSKIEI